MRNNYLLRKRAQTTIGCGVFIWCAVYCVVARVRWP